MTIVDTTSNSDPEIKTIGDSLSHNTSNTSFKKECKKYSANNPVHDDGDYSIASHQKSMFIVQLHIVQD